VQALPLGTCLPYGADPLSTSQGICTRGKSDPGVAAPICGLLESHMATRKLGPEGQERVSKIISSCRFNVLSFTVYFGLRDSNLFLFLCFEHGISISYFYIVLVYCF
jgi:hypothetical protein